MGDIQATQPAPVAETKQAEPDEHEAKATEVYNSAEEQSEEKSDEEPSGVPLIKQMEGNHHPPNPRDIRANLKQQKAAAKLSIGKIQTKLPLGVIAAKLAEPPDLAGYSEEQKALQLHTGILAKYQGETGKPKHSFAPYNNEGEIPVAKPKKPRPRDFPLKDRNGPEYQAFIRAQEQAKVQAKAQSAKNADARIQAKAIACAVPKVVINGDPKGGNVRQITITIEFGA